MAGADDRAYYCIRGCRCHPAKSLGESTWKWHGQLGVSMENHGENMPKKNGWCRSKKLDDFLMMSSIFWFLWLPVQARFGGSGNLLLSLSLVLVVSRDAMGWGRALYLYHLVPVIIKCGKLENLWNRVWRHQVISWRWIFQQTMFDYQWEYVSPVWNGSTQFMKGFLFPHFF